MKKMIILAMAVTLCLMLSGCADEGQITDGTAADNAGSALPTGTYTSDPAKDQPSEIVPGSLSYVEFMSLSPVDQQEYMYSFGNDAEGMEKFLAWYAEARAKFEAEQPEIGPGDGNIDIGDFIDKHPQ